MVKCDFGPEITFLGKLICKTNYNHGTLAPAAVLSSTRLHRMHTSTAKFSTFRMRNSTAWYGRTKLSTVLQSSVHVYLARYRVFRLVFPLT
jgi:hypothetical protein